MRILASVLLASLPLVNASAQCKVAQFPPAEAVAISPYGDTLAMSRQGAVTIYEAQCGDWLPKDTLASPPESGFGSHLALSDDTLAVSAPLDDALGTDAGAVTLYERYGPYWVPVYSFLGFGQVAGDLFGSSIGLSGNTLAISAPGDAEGAVYIFERDGGVGIPWKLMAKIEAPPGVHDFGSDIAVTKTEVVVLVDHRDAYHYSDTLSPSWAEGPWEIDSPSTAVPYDAVAKENDTWTTALCSPTSGLVTIFFGPWEIEPQTLGFGTSIALHGLRLLVSAADGLHVFVQDPYPAWSFTEVSKIADTGAVTAAFNHFTLSDASGVRLYSFFPADCRDQHTQVPLPAGKHP